MNPTLLTDYNKRLEIAKAKIEVLDMVLESLKYALLRANDNVDYTHGEFAKVTEELEIQQTLIQAYILGIKNNLQSDWQRLEPKRENYGGLTTPAEWTDVQNAKAYQSAHERWQELEPFKTTENDLT